METGCEERNMNFWKTEAEYFCAEGWTGEIRLEWLRKIVVLALSLLGNFSIQRSSSVRSLKSWDFDLSSKLPLHARTNQCDYRVRGIVGSLTGANGASTRQMSRAA
jgi:hypothetical protein